MSCEHGRQRSSCKECGGSSICEHKRRRYFCKDCGGKGICEHGRRRSKCKECPKAGGEAKAGGGKRKREESRCSDCNEKMADDACAGCSSCEKSWLCLRCAGFESIEEAEHGTCHCKACSQMLSKRQRKRR